MCYTSDPKYRTMQEIKMDVKTICGCTLTCDWPRGDRRLACEHGRFWIVRKDERTTEQFTLAKETFPDGG